MAGLTNSPVTDRFGNFLRYEILVNELELGGHLPWSRYMLISGQWLKASVLPPEPEPPASLECATVADDVFFGIVNAGAIEPKVQTRGGDIGP